MKGNRGLKISGSWEKEIGHKISLTFLFSFFFSFEKCRFIGTKIKPACTKGSVLIVLILSETFQGEKLPYWNAPF